MGSIYGESSNQKRKIKKIKTNSMVSANQITLTYHLIKSSPENNSNKKIFDPPSSMMRVLFIPLQAMSNLISTFNWMKSSTSVKTKIIVPLQHINIVIRVES